jgi:hypothetical protein
MQIHDAILIQYPDRDEDHTIQLVRKQLAFPISLPGKRVFTIPYGVATGWNWGKHSEKNPDGLKYYTPGDKRRRTPPLSILDRKFPRLHRQFGSR